MIIFKCFANPFCYFLFILFTANKIESLHSNYFEYSTGNKKKRNLATRLSLFSVATNVPLFNINVHSHHCGVGIFIVHTELKIIVNSLETWFPHHSTEFSIIAVSFSTHNIIIIMIYLRDTKKKNTNFLHRNNKSLVVNRNIQFKLFTHTVWHEVNHKIFHWKRTHLKCLYCYTSFVLRILFICDNSCY